MADRWIVIRNWDKYQHRDAIRSRGDGIQAWVKDYTAQLHDDDWHNLTLAERGLLQTLRLEYAASRGRLPGDPLTLSRRLGVRVRDEHLAALNHAGFIEFVLGQPDKIMPHRREVEEKEKDLDLRSKTTAEPNGRKLPGFEIPNDLLKQMPN